jgi:hypothetical protein
MRRITLDELPCAGFVQVNNAYAIGGAWTNYSTRGGAQYIFNMTWTLFNGDWWLWLQAPTRAAGSATTPTGSSTAGS